MSLKRLVRQNSRPRFAYSLPHLPCSTAALPALQQQSVRNVGPAGKKNKDHKVHNVKYAPDSGQTWHAYLTHGL
jgi:hypothetical protein